MSFRHNRTVVVLFPVISVGPSLELLKLKGGCGSPNISSWLGRSVGGLGTPEIGD